MFLIRQHTGRELAKDDPELVRVHEELGRQFDAGRQTAVEWEEIAGLLGGQASQRSTGRPLRDSRRSSSKERAVDGTATHGNG